MEFNEHHDREFRELREENRIFRVELKLAHHDIRRLLDIIDRLVPSVSKKLTNIKLNFGGTMANSVTLNVGQATKATVIALDQNGAPFTGTLPAVTYTVDQPSVANANPDGNNGADVTGVAGGSAVLTASLTTNEGLALTAQGNIAVNPVTTAPVLSSIQVDFSQPA